MQRTAGLTVVIVVCCAAAGLAADPPRRPLDPPRQPLDPLQQAVVDSLAWPPRTTAAEFFAAAIRCTEIDAAVPAVDFVRRFLAALAADEKNRVALLADLGDTYDALALGRLERLVAAYEPAASQAIAAIRAASTARRLDPATLTAAAADLASDSAAVRAAAVERLARAQEGALPILVDLLQAEGPAAARVRPLARAVVARLGPAARQPLLAWLGSDDVAHWSGIIAALDAADAADVEPFLLAPALVDNTPPAARAAARSLLARRVGGRGAVPDVETAVAALAARLDRVLAPDGLPQIDQLCPEPITDPAAAVKVFGGSPRGTVDRFVWNAAQRRVERIALPPRAARAQEAIHLARDLVALDARDPAAVRLVLLAQLEPLVLAAATAGGVPAADARRFRTALAGPDGFDADVAADVLDLAVTHGLFESAAAACAAIAPPGSTADAAPTATLPPAARAALVRALAVPDAGLQFAAARALALAGGDPPYPGSSRVVDVLRHAATARGDDVAIVVHPDTEVAQMLAAGVGRFGYRTIRVSTGRQAVFAARDEADTVLVLLAARSITPTPLETVQFLRLQPVGGSPAVLVVVDPLDDEARGCFLQQLLLVFRSEDCVGIVDRMESFFGPADDDGPARFTDALVQVAGPRAVDPASRETERQLRLARAHEALQLLAALAGRGWDVAAAADTARLAADARYNLPDDAAVRDAARAVLRAIEAPSRGRPPTAVDASPDRPTR